MRNLVLSLFFLCFASASVAQGLSVSTVTRPPFSFEDSGADAGFSMDLWREIATTLEQDFTVTRHDSFSAMLEAVKDGTSNVAIANISITAKRELDLDFSQPIFGSGLQIMIPRQTSGGSSIWRAIASWDLVFAVLAAFAVLLAGGMLMWQFERRDQEYFKRPWREAMFPSFWWALNLVVNGGFEERMPRTPFGRLFGVLLVISSLFVVSVFVARITSVMTVEAITGSVNSINDLYGKRVATIENSTAEAFLSRRDLSAQTFGDLQDMLRAFQDGTVDAVVFDAPILAYYVNTDQTGFSQLAGPVFNRENYGIAVQSSDPLREEINQALLSLREDGTYAQIHRKWFGTNP